MFPPMPHHSLRAPGRRKYSAARAFFASVVLMSIFAIWSVAVARRKDRNEYASLEIHRLLRRSYPLNSDPFVDGANDDLQATDLDASLSLLDSSSGLASR